MTWEVGGAGSGKVKSRMRLVMVGMLDMMTFHDFLHYHTFRILVIEVLTDDDRLRHVDTIFTAVNVWCRSWAPGKKLISDVKDVNERRDRVGDARAVSIMFTACL